MKWLAQCTVVAGMYLRTVPQRLGASVTAAAGVAGVVGVMVAVLSIGEGFRATLDRTGSPDNAVVMRTGSDSEMSSLLSMEQVRIIGDGPGVRRGATGALASAEMYVIVDLPKRSTGTEANVPLRGVQPAAFDIREQVRIVEGRRFESGRNEILAGVGAAREFAGQGDLGQACFCGVGRDKAISGITGGAILTRDDDIADALEEEEQGATPVPRVLGL